jgi:hypothetical protein
VAFQVLGILNQGRRVDKRSKGSCGQVTSSTKSACKTSAASYSQIPRISLDLRLLSLKCR